MAPISPTSVLLVLAALAVMVWGGVLSLKMMARQRDEGWALQGCAIVAAGLAVPLGQVLIPVRTFGNFQFGAVVVPTPAIRVGQMLLLITLGCALAGLLVGPHRVVPRAARVLLLAIWVYEGSRLVSGLFGEGGQSLWHVLILPVVLLSLTLSRMSLPTLLQILRWPTRLVTYGSLIAAFLVPAWAYMPDSSGRFFGFDRLAGLADHANSLGPIAAMSLLLELAGPRAQKRWVTLNVAVALTVLALCQSLTSWAAGALGLAVLLLVKFGRLALLLLVAGLVFVMTVFWHYVGSLVGTALSTPEYSTLTGRTSIWSFVLGQWHHHIWLGIGPGFLSPSYRVSQVPASLQFAGQAHDQLLQSLGEGGIVGVATLVVLVVVSIVAAVRTARVTQGLSLALVSVILIESVTESPLRLDSFDAFFWLALGAFGVILVSARPSRTSRVEPEPTEPVPALVTLTGPG